MSDLPTPPPSFYAPPLQKRRSPEELAEQREAARQKRYEKKKERARASQGDGEGGSLPSREEDRQVLCVVAGEFGMAYGPIGKPGGGETWVMTRNRGALLKPEERSTHIRPDLSRVRDRLESIEQRRLRRRQQKGEGV